MVAGVVALPFAPSTIALALTSQTSATPARHAILHGWVRGEDGRGIPDAVVTLEARRVFPKQVCRAERGHRRCFIRHVHRDVVVATRQTGHLGGWKMQLSLQPGLYRVIVTVHHRSVSRVLHVTHGRRYRIDVREVAHHLIRVVWLPLFNY